MIWKMKLYNGKMKWHRWFAWRPVVVDGELCRWFVWWSYVYRRREWISMGDWWWNHRMNKEKS